MRPPQHAALLHQLQSLYSLSHASRVLSWLNASCAGDAYNLRSTVQRHVEGHEPLAYLIGTQPFGRHLDLRVRPPTLIPRPETEEWATRLARHLNNHQSKETLRILEIGSGTGCIPLLLASEVDATSTKLDITSIDKSSTALDLAKENFALHKSVMRHPVTFTQADLFDNTAMRRLGSFDLVVSNPPYISSDEYTELDQSVRAWEDVGALVPSSAGASDGLECYRRIAELLPGLLSKESQSELAVVLEVGWQQADTVGAPLQDTAELRRTEIWRDMHNRQRVVTGWREQSMH